MQEDKSRNYWSRLNEVNVPEEMRKNNNSAFWIKCDGLIRDFIHGRFLNIPRDIQDEMVQETLLSVYRGLPTFRHQSKFTTWLAIIAHNRSIDVLRRRTTKMQREIYLYDLPEDDESDADYTIVSPLRTPEEIALTNEYLHETVIALEAFLRLHGKIARNRRILHMVLFNGQHYEETAQALGVSTPLIRYVVRSAQTYLKQRPRAC